MTYRFDTNLNSWGYTYMGASTVNEPEDYDDVVVANKWEPPSDMEAALKDWDAQIDAAAEKKRAARKAEGAHKALKGSQITALISAGSSATKAESEFYSSPEFIESFDEVVDLNVDAETAKEKVDVKRAAFEMRRSEYSARSRV